MTARLIRGLVIAPASEILEEGRILRRLFSTFAPGGPGVGLLLLRLAAGICVIARGIARLLAGLPAGSAAAEVLAMAAGILLIAGLWTPASATLIAVFGLWRALSQAGDQWSNILLAIIGAALALLGPGAWSVDARLFGWKRIDVHD